MYEVIKESSYTLIEKKSKFICRIFKIEKEEEAKAKIREIVNLEKGAIHNCYAYRIWNKNGIIERKDDDGEPSGTAGNPMLSILIYENLINILAITTRYFGGIKLGANGLVNAYKKSVIEAIKNTEKREFVLKENYIIRFYINNTKKIDNFLKNSNIEVNKREFKGLDVEYYVKSSKEEMDNLRNIFNQDIVEIKNLN